MKEEGSVKMSISASIDLAVSSRKFPKTSAIEILESLLKFGWTFNDSGRKSYLPLGDKDDFNWQMEDISSERLMSILIKKEQQNETIGVGMTWADTGIGGMILLTNGGNLSLTLSINRKMIEDIKNDLLTDVNWYLTKLLPPLDEGGMIVESISYYSHV